MSYIIVFIINVCLALWVQHDAKNLRTRGVPVIPGIWSTLVFFGSLPLFIVYILVRLISYGPKSKMGMQPLPKASGWTNWLVLILLIVVVGGILLAIVVFSSMLRARSANVNTNVPLSAQTSSQESNKNLQPSIISIFPSAVSVGSSVTITGSGFASKGNDVLLFYNDAQGVEHPQVQIYKLSSTDGVTLVFTVPQQLTYPNEHTNIATPSGSYQLWVINDGNGNRSGSASLTVK